MERAAERLPTVGFEVQVTATEGRQASKKSYLFLNVP